MCSRTGTVVSTDDSHEGNPQAQGCAQGGLCLWRPTAFSVRVVVGEVLSAMDANTVCCAGITTRGKQHMPCIDKYERADRNAVSAHYRWAAGARGEMAVSGVVAVNVIGSGSRGAGEHPLGHGATCLPLPRQRCRIPSASPRWAAAGEPALLAAQPDRTACRAHRQRRGRRGSRFRHRPRASSS